MGCSLICLGLLILLTIGWWLPFPFGLIGIIIGVAGIKILQFEAAFLFGGEDKSEKTTPKCPDCGGPAGKRESGRCLECEKKATGTRYHCPRCKKATWVSQDDPSTAIWCGTCGHRFARSEGKQQYRCPECDAPTRREGNCFSCRHPWVRW